MVYFRDDIYGRDGVDELRFRRFEFVIDEWIKAACGRPFRWGWHSKILGPNVEA